MELFQWFFMVLSVRPSRTLAISAHLLLCFLCIRNKIHSSSLDQFIFLIRGFKWLCQRSLHCLPIRPAKCSAIVVHLYGPCCSTSCSTRQSSSSVHGPFIKVTLWFFPEVFYKFINKRLLVPCRSFSTLSFGHHQSSNRHFHHFLPIFWTFDRRLRATYQAIWMYLLLIYVFRDPFTR